MIATGSRPVVPPIEGLSPVNGNGNGHGNGNGKRPADKSPDTFKHGIFVFRTLADCDRMLRYVNRVRRAAVIGGGLLGLEAARGLLNAGLEVHVVHLMPHLMETQLDAAGGQVLRRQLEQMGMTFHLGTATTAVLGETEVTGLAFKDGATLDCEMVVIATGVKPNVDIAVRAGLVVERGIVVGDDLACTGVEGVYAIGECAQHRGRVYGLVAPLWEQAQVLADRLSGKNPRALYVGSKPSTKLKVAGVDLAAMGERDAAEEDDEVVSYGEPARGVYKKLIVRRDRLVGAIVIGDGAIVPSLLRVFSESTAIPADRAELLFRAMAAAPPSTPQIPDEALVCNCNGVTKAQIIEAVLGGARSLGAVCDATRASTGCGSCRPEVEAIVGLACQGLAAPDLLAAGDRPAEDVEVREPAGADVVVTHNKIERYKSEKDGLDIVHDIPRFAQEGWQAIDDGDKERLKWAGIFFRRQTPGRFMMRVRMTSGQATALQIRTMAEITRDFGVGFADITTRQQIQLRGYQIEQVEEIWRRLEEVGLVSLQTGMDNIRGVVGCPAAGLTRHELFDASPIAQEFTDNVLKNKAFTNLPRKFNVAITGCTEHCTHAETQDLALVPAVRMSHGVELKGFNVLVGGKMGSGGYRVASPLDVFVQQSDAALLCAHITRDLPRSRIARDADESAPLVSGRSVGRREVSRRAPAPRRQAASGGRQGHARVGDHAIISASSRRSNPG